MTTEDYLEAFLTHLRSLNRAESTLDWYATLLRRFFAFAREHGVDQVGDVTTPLVLDYQKHVADSLTRHGRSFTVGMQNLHLSVVAQFYEYLRRAGYAVHNPARDLEYARLPQRLPKAVPTSSQIKKLLKLPDTKSVLGYRDRTIFEVFYSTGIRNRELGRLRVEDVNLEEGFLFIRQGKGKKDRVVPLGRIAGKYLETYLAGIRPEILGNRSDPGFVFLSLKGGALSKNGLGQLVRRYARQARLKVTPHSFRHACATHMIRNRANVRHVQEMLGHARLETTQRYLALTITDLKDAHSKFHPREKDA